jgi:hypothetical protein
MSKSKDKKIEIREVVYSQDDEKSFGDIFVYEPENIEEQNLGNLFIVGELKDLPRNSSYVVNLIASKIKKEFYSNTKRSAEESLESALSTANQTFSELADQGSSEYIGKLSMICGTYRENKFYLSQVGKIKSLLVRGGQIIEIIKEEDSKPASPKRAFNNIASGELAEGDVVIFGTSGLFNIYSLEKLRQMASSLELDEFASKMQEEVEDEDSEVVSALILEISGAKKEEKMNHVEVGLQNQNKEKEITLEVPEIQPEEEFKNEIPYVAPEVISEAKVNEGEKEYVAPAEDDITDENIDDATDDSEELQAKQTNLVFPAESETAENVETAETDNVNDRDVELNGRETEKISLSDIIKEYEKIESKPSESDMAKDKNIENIIGKKENPDFQDLDDSHQQGFIKGVKNFLNGLKTDKLKLLLAAGVNKISSSKKEYKIQNGDKKIGLFSSKKILVAVALVIIVVVAFGVYPKLSGNNNDKNKAAHYQAMLSDSQSKLDQAGKDIASGSIPDAGKLFVESKTLATQVKNEYGKLGSQADSIISSAQSEIDKMDKVVRADNAQTVATFDNIDINNLVEIAGNYYAIAGKDNAVYKVDVKGNKLTQLASAGNKIGEIKLAQNFQNQEILLSDGDSFSSFGLKSSAIQKLNTKLDATVKGVASYGKNVYLLSPSKNQIYKFQKSAQGLENQTEWLKGGDIPNAVSMAVDQYIFVLSSDGTVKKYLSGQEFADQGKKFSLKQPSDPITSATKIFTLTDQKYLYIMESGKSRVLIYDKTSGDLVKQMTGDGFGDIKDISVDTKETTLTALMTNKIIKVSLQ